MRRSDVIAILGLLPLNLLITGYGWLAVGMTGWADALDGERSRVPLEAAVACAAAGVIGVGLVFCRLWGAAVFQLLPVGATVALMTV
ncbi:hypothetical protein [Streptomyces sp. CAU 1734]|uniref:hypothetical protein n=1 Tax=Streptomyces sp. CAU 1734 TaxID=3140360 RepID=UPI00325FE201